MFCKVGGHTESWCHLKEEKHPGWNKCTYCNLLGHVVADCQKKKWEEKGPQGGIAPKAVQIHLKKEVDMWIADSGASHDMPHSKFGMKNCREAK